MDKRKFIIIISVLILVVAIIGVVIFKSNAPADIVATTLNSTNEVLVNTETLNENNGYSKEELTKSTFKIFDKTGFTCYYPVEFKDKITFVSFVNPQTDILEKISVRFKENNYTIFSFIITSGINDSVNVVNVDNYSISIELGYEANPYNTYGPQINEIRDFGLIAMNYVEKANLKKDSVEEVTIEENSVYKPLPPQNIKDTTSTDINTSKKPQSSKTTENATPTTTPTTLLPILPSTTSAKNDKYPIPADGKYTYFEVKDGKIIVNLKVMTSLGLISKELADGYVGSQIDGDGYTIYYFRTQTGGLTSINANEILYVYDIKTY